MEGVRCLYTDLIDTCSMHAPPVPPCPMSYMMCLSFYLLWILLGKEIQHATTKNLFVRMANAMTNI